MKESRENQRTILVVEDDASLSATLSDFLSYEGFYVETADSGEKALVILRRKKPDLIILDISMPGMGGIGFLDRITNADGSMQCPVLVLTARAAMAESFANRQIEGFLAKPCDLSDLLTEVNRVIFAQSIPVANPVKDAFKMRRVLLGDSNAEFNATLRGELVKAGLMVDAVLTGPQVLEGAIICKPDVVAMRMELRGMSADEIIQTMRRIPGTAEIPVIVYGLDEPGVPVDHIARLDITKVRIINDLSVNRIVESVLTAITNYRTMPK